MLHEILLHRRKDDSGGAVFGKAINPCGNGWQRHRRALKFLSDAQRACHRSLELIILITISPDGTHGMDDVFCRQVATRGPGGARMGYSTMVQNPGIRFLLDYRSALFRNRARDAAAMLEEFIRRIDNGVHFFDCDVTLNDLNGLLRWEYLLKKNRIHKMKINYELSAFA